MSVPIEECADVLLERPPEHMVSSHGRRLARARGSTCKCPPLQAAEHVVSCPMGNAPRAPMKHLPVTSARGRRTSPRIPLELANVRGMQGFLGVWSGGHLQVLRVHAKQCIWGKTTCSPALSGGHSQALQRARAHQCRWKHRDCVMLAAKGGHFHLIKWVLAKHNPLCGELILAHAALGWHHQQPPMKDIFGFKDSPLLDATTCSVAAPGRTCKGTNEYYPTGNP